MKCRFVVSALVLASVSMVACDRAPTITSPPGNSLSPLFDTFHDTSNSMDVPWNDEEQNPCNGDIVSISGVSHFLFITTENTVGGTYHLSTRRNSDGTGVGFPSLGTYNVMEEFSYMEQDAIPSSTIRQVDDLTILAPKSADNYIKHQVMKITINGNGVPTVSRDSTWTKCVG